MRPHLTLVLGFAGALALAVLVGAGVGALSTDEPSLYLWIDDVCDYGYVQASGLDPARAEAVDLHLDPDGIGPEKGRHFSWRVSGASAWLKFHARQGERYRASILRGKDVVLATHWKECAQ